MSVVENRFPSTAGRGAFASVADSVQVLPSVAIDAPVPFSPTRVAETRFRFSAVPVDHDWRRRVAGLQDLARGKQSRRLFLWPANDRSRRISLHVNSTLPLHVLTASVGFFAAALGLVGVGSFLIHPEWMPPLLAGLLP